MQHEDKYLDHIKELIQEVYAPVDVSKLPKGLSFFSTEQLMAKFGSFVPNGILTKESIYALMEDMRFQLAEIKPFSYVWVCKPKTA